MQEKKPYKYDLKCIIQRIKELEGVKFDSEVANLIDYPAKSLSYWKKSFDLIGKDEPPILKIRLYFLT